MLFRSISLMVSAILALWFVACAGGMKPTQFTNPRFDFAFVERAAVLPLENLTRDRQAGVRVTRILITELLSSGALDVVEPGEVQAALDRIPRTGETFSSDQLIGLGKTLGVQAIFVGTVTQSETIRAGSTSVPTVTIDLHMLETETGASVWAATHTERGSGVSDRWLGTGAEPISQTARKCVQQLLATLLS